MADTLAKAYDPKEVEDRYYQWWVEQGFFKGGHDPNQQPFTIVIPPPNVTGQLHLGHAMDNTIQDLLIRWQRMQGTPTLWVPGTDHAGLATQIRVEEELKKTENKSRHDLGRDAFVDRVWQWKEQYGNQITDQLKKLGASCDWSRERFTLDEGLSRAVRHVFVSLYKKGLIYRGTRITNWCPHCLTALSDIEVEHEEGQGKMHYIRYPFADGSGHLTIATTRPETMLGDTAVVVNPNDERYSHLIGKHVILPILNRKLPVIADEYVDPEFGTGAMKVTPFHDPNDFELGEKHKLPSIQVIGWDGTMTAEAGPYQGQDRYECRKNLLRDLEEQGFLEKIEDHTLAAGTCQRCGTVVEPLISTQWFVKMAPLAKPAIEVVAKGEVRIIPERFEKVYMHWLENIQDWCISRQIWWGHRIPVFTCQDCGQEICEEEDPTHCPKCNSTNLRQDPDALDTWFSSALWPFSTLGWPEQTADFDYYYPTSVLVTGYDIIFFWVARMIFMGLEFTGKPPFHTVFLHGLVRDSEGRKMSKSLGNGVDPMAVIDKYGTDALRFTLITGNTPGNDMRFYWERVEASRNFANKLWNASRFVLMNLQDDEDLLTAAAPGALELADRWILSRYNATVKSVQTNLEAYQLGEAARALYDFIWDEFCDWYIELVKPRLYGGDGSTARWVLRHVLDGTLRLLHPFMPFITEAIWQKLPHEGESIMIAPWPQAGETDPEAEAKMASIMEAIRAIRNLRAELGVAPGKRSPVVIQALSPEAETVLGDGAAYITDLGRAEPLTLGPVSTDKPAQAAAAVAGGAEIYLPLAGLIDFEKETERLKKEEANLLKDLERTQKKLSNPGFLSKAAPEVVEKERAKEAEFTEKLKAIRGRLELLK